MQGHVLRKIFLAFSEVHILHHASKEPIYGTWMMEELEHHGYEMSAGTIYPILHNLEKAGLLASKSEIINGKTRKYYTTTEAGKEVLEKAKVQIQELTHEL